MAEFSPLDLEIELHFKMKIKITHNTDVLEQHKSIRELGEPYPSPSDLASIPVL